MAHFAGASHPRADSCDGRLQLRRQASTAWDVTVQHRRAASCSALGPSTVAPTLATSRSSVQLRLEQTIEQLCQDNAQWQAAYETYAARVAQLEAENETLHEALEAAETGPNMSARYVARLARQNWKLARELGERNAEVDRLRGIQDTPPPTARPSVEDAPDSGRGLRPSGVRKLPLDGLANGSSPSTPVGRLAVGDSCTSTSSSSRMSRASERITEEEKACDVMQGRLGWAAAAVAEEALRGGEQTPQVSGGAQGLEPAAMHPPCSRTATSAIAGKSTLRSHVEMLLIYAAVALPTGLALLRYFVQDFDEFEL